MKEKLYLSEIWQI